MENPGLAATVTSGVGTKNMGSVRQYPMPSQHLRHSLEDKALQPSIFVLGECLICLCGERRPRKGDFCIHLHLCRCILLYSIFVLFRLIDYRNLGFFYVIVVPALYSERVWTGNTFLRASILLL